MHLWRLNSATGELKQLTSGKWESGAACTPDGKWVLYSAIAADGLDRVYKISIDGGTPVEMASRTDARPVVSPDGALIVYGKTDGQGASAKSKFVDGRALTFINNTTGNTMNVYMQPLAGGAPVQLTHFDSEPAVVSAYAWSRDGKQFAVTRSRYNDTDVVMFSGFR